MQRSKLGKICGDGDGRNEVSVNFRVLEALSALEIYYLVFQSIEDFICIFFNFRISTFIICPDQTLWLRTGDNISVFSWMSVRVTSSQYNA